MRITSAHLRWVASGAAALVVVPVAGQWFIEYAAALGFYRHPVERAHDVITLLADITSQQWFHWIGGGVIGFFAGVWLDVLVRRNDQPSEGSGPEVWVTPSEAIRRYLDPYYTEATEKYEADYEAKLALSDLAHAEWSADQQNTTLRDEFQELSTATSIADNIRATSHRISSNALVDALKGGELVAKGIAVVGGVAGDEVDIPIAYWRFMSLNVVGETCGGTGRSYTGVRIARPSRLGVLSSRIPPPSTGEETQP